MLSPAKKCCLFLIVILFLQALLSQINNHASPNLVIQSASEPPQNSLPWCQMDDWLQAWDTLHSAPSFPPCNNQFCTIPKSIPPRTPRQGTSRIPRQLWQTLKSNNVSKVVYEVSRYALLGLLGENIQSCVNQNPEYHYRLFDDNDSAEFLKFWHEDIRRAYCIVASGAGKADIWRALVTYRFGGVYLDADAVCITPLDQFIISSDDVVTGMGFRGDPHQWFLAYSPRSILIKTYISDIVRALFSYEKSPPDGAVMEDITGPPVLLTAWEKVLTERDCQALTNMKVITQPVVFPCKGIGNLHFFPTDDVGGNILFKNDALMKEFREQTPNWEDLGGNFIQASKCAPFPSAFDPTKELSLDLPY